MSNTAVEFLKASNDVILIAHVAPDGDALGATLALYQGLVRLGKRVQAVCDDPVPYGYRFLPCADRLVRTEEAYPAAAAVAVDCADVGRMGRAAGLFQKAERTLCVDHHETNPRFADVNYVEPCAATGELIDRILFQLGVPLTEEIADCLYTALVADTGNFSYSNTTPDTFRIAAELLEAGIDLPELNRNLFRTVPLRKTKLLGRVISNMKLSADGLVAVSALSRADMDACGANGEDTEGIVENLRDIETVEVAALLRESPEGIRVSLRGKRYADVSRIALAFSGGGHKRAAGCTIHEPLKDAESKVLRAAERLIAEAHG